MNHRPQIQFNTTDIFWGVLIVLVGTVILAQCHLTSPREQTIFDAPYTVDTSEIVIDTCQPMPQCVDPEPPQGSPHDPN